MARLNKRQRDSVALMRFAGDFTTACEKIKQGAQTEDSAVSLTQSECVALITGLRVAFNKKEE